MITREDLPDDLSEDMEVLFVKPYTPEENEEMLLSGSTDTALMQIFERAHTRDPGFVNFEDTVAVVKTMLGLGGYCLGDDLILLYGDKQVMEQAQDKLKDRFTCFFDTVGSFIDHVEINGPAVVPKAQPTVH